MYKRQHPPDAAEREAAISFISGSFPRERETPSDAVGELWSLDLAGLPRDWFDRYLARVRSTDAKALGQTADALVDDRNLVIVVVGPAKLLEPKLRQFGKVEVVKP